jgi:ribosomal protein L22
MTEVQARPILSVSAQKVRLVIDLVRSKPANDALEVLRLLNRVARCRSESW